MNKKYHNDCPIAKVANLLSDPWTMLLIRDLLKKELRFCGILETAGGWNYCQGLLMPQIGPRETNQLTVVTVDLSCLCEVQVMAGDRACPASPPCLHNRIPSP